LESILGLLESLKFGHCTRKIIAELKAHISGMENADKNEPEEGRYISSSKENIS
jgi:hypothetical protein